MNLILLRRDDIGGDQRVTLRDHRFAHIRRVLGLQPGDSVRVGILDGKRGRAELLESAPDAAVLRIVELDDEPPEALDLRVVLALPRPKMLRRILRTLSEVGVKDIHLINSYRVQKSYWQSPLLQPAAMQEALCAGLEQVMDTVLPRVQLHHRFRPFVEDQLPALCSGRQALLGLPDSRRGFPARPATPGLLLIGPEGGFIPFENDLLQSAGAQGVSLGNRVLRVETALHCALGAYLARA